jgi:hypothetical protein
LYKLYSSLFHLGRQPPPSCVGPYILRNIFISSVLLSQLGLDETTGIVNSWVSECFCSLALWKGHSVLETTSFSVLRHDFGASYLLGSRR